MSDSPTRVFFALRPDEEGLRFLTAQQEHLKRCGWDRYGRFLSPESLHLTVRFIGPAGPEAVAALAEACREIADAIPDFSFELGRAVLFPRVSRAKIIAARVTPNASLRELGRAVERAAQESGAKEADHPFRPHVTLARLKPATSRPNIPSLAGRVPSRAGRLILCASHLAGDGATYEELDGFPFRKG